MSIFDRIKNTVYTLLGISSAPVIKKPQIRNPHAISKLSKTDSSRRKGKLL